MTVSELIEALKAMPQDAEVWSNESHHFDPLSTVHARQDPYHLEKVIVVVST